ncbi:MAG: hypothetical protein ABEH56_01510 [Salinirussus sp.]
MPTELIPGRRDARPGGLLRAVELTYHPALSLVVLAAVHVVASPVPAIGLSPLSFGQPPGGVPVTVFLAGVIVVDVLVDVFGVAASAATGDG